MGAYPVFVVRALRDPERHLKAMYDDGTRGSKEAALAWMGRQPDNTDGPLTVETEDGAVKSSTGDWVVRDKDGKFHLFKPEAFVHEYEYAGLLDADYESDIDSMPEALARNALKRAVESFNSAEVPPGLWDDRLEWAVRRLGDADRLDVELKAATDRASKERADVLACLGARRGVPLAALRDDVSASGAAAIVVGYYEGVISELERRVRRAERTAEALSTENAEPCAGSRSFEFQLRSVATRVHAGAPKFEVEAIVEAHEVFARPGGAHVVSLVSSGVATVRLCVGPDGRVESSESDHGSSDVPWGFLLESVVLTLKTMKEATFPSRDPDEAKRVLTSVFRWPMRFYGGTTAGIRTKGRFEFRLDGCSLVEHSISSSERRVRFFVSARSLDGSGHSEPAGKVAMSFGIWPDGSVDGLTLGLLTRCSGWKPAPWGWLRRRFEEELKSAVSQSIVGYGDFCDPDAAKSALLKAAAWPLVTE